MAYCAVCYERRTLFENLILKLQNKKSSSYLFLLLSSEAGNLCVPGLQQALPLVAQAGTPDPGGDGLSCVVSMWSSCTLDLTLSLRQRPSTFQKKPISATYIHNLLLTLLRSG